MKEITLTCSTEIARRLGAIRVPEDRRRDTEARIASQPVEALLNSIVIHPTDSSDLWLWGWVEGVFKK